MTAINGDDRSIGGPPKRRERERLTPANAAGLLPKNRTPAAPNPDDDFPALVLAPKTVPSGASPAPETPAAGEPHSVPAPISPTLAPVTPPVSSTAVTRKEKMSFNLTRDTQDRLRAVFLATRTQEEDSSLSSIAEELIVAECERREALYNGGARYKTSNKPLPAGRPIQ